jgi:hypothetical protein
MSLLIIIIFMETIVPVNYWAVIVSAIVAMVLGFIWYGPLFGKQWMKLMGISRESMKKTDNMWVLYLLQIIGVLLMVYVLSHSLVFTSRFFGHLTPTLQDGLMVAFWSWLGFIAPVTLGTVLWEQKSWRLWFLNNAYQLITLLIAGMILASWLPM